MNPSPADTRFVLVHMSDLHMGEVLLNKKTRIINGLRCHHIELCKALHMALNELQAHLGNVTEADYQFLITGDVTSHGLPIEFYVAQRYVHMRLPDDHDDCLDSTGLSLPFAKTWSVPGNHDHWYPHFPFTFARGYSPRLFPAHFRSTPWKGKLESQDKRLTIEVFGIDSNSGFSRRHLNVRAHGRISIRERDALTEKLAAPPVARGGEATVRLLLCHHALSPARQFRMLDAQPLRIADAEWLVECCAKHKVTAILTGHHHVVYADLFPPVIELRSPSTLVPGNDGSAGFLVHILDRAFQSDIVNWTVQVWLYKESEGSFKPVHKFSFPAVTL